MGSIPPAAFSPRPDDDDDVRWALSTALAQWNQGGRADAVVWLRRAGEAADASGAPARATELRRHAATLAETLWSQPPPAGDEIDIDVEVSPPDRKAPLPPPPAAVRAVQARVPSLPSLPPLSTRPVDRQSIAELEPARERYASAPEIVLEEEALDASELEEILDYVGEDDIDAVPVQPVSSKRRGAVAFDDRLSSASEPPLTVEALLPVGAGEPELLVGEEADLVIDRLSETEAFVLRPSERAPAPSERPPAVALPPDDRGIEYPGIEYRSSHDHGVEEDFDDRVTMVPLSHEAEAVRAASARSVPPDAFTDGGHPELTIEVRESEPTELLEGEAALAIDGDLRDSYRPESIDLGADWAPIESERGPGVTEDRPSAFDEADAFGRVSADVESERVIARQTRDSLRADEFETQFGGSEPPRDQAVSELELIPLSVAEPELSSTAEAELIPLSSSDVELLPMSSHGGAAFVPESEVIESLSEADLIPVSIAAERAGTGSTAAPSDASELESLPPLEFPSEPPLEAEPMDVEVSLDVASSSPEPAAAPEAPTLSVRSVDLGDVDLGDMELSDADLASVELEVAEAAVDPDDMLTPVAPAMPPEQLLEQEAALTRSASEAPLEPAPSVSEEDSPGPATLASRSSAPPASEPALATTTVVDGVDLMTARGFEDLPEDVQLKLAGLARVETLAAGEEVGLFGAAIITHGQVNVLPAFADESGAVATQSDVIFTRGSLEDSIALRVVAKVDETRVAVWDPQPFADAIEACPWVHDELRLIADRFLALCGATLGPLGERLDESLRSAVFQRLEVRSFGPGEELLTEGKALPGLFVIGGGRVDILTGGEVREQKSPGDFLFATAIMGGAKSPATARAGETGALALFAPRGVAHELMISVPPLLEVLAG